MKLPRRAFVPHLTIGQFKSEADCQAFLESSPPIVIEADVCYLSLLARTTMQQPFRTAWRVVLGGNLAVAVEQGSSEPYAFRAAGKADVAEEKQAEWEERQDKAADKARRDAEIKAKKETNEKAKLKVKEKAMKEAEEKANQNEFQDCTRKVVAEYNTTMPGWEVPVPLQWRAGAMVDDTEGSKVVGAPPSQQEVSSQAVAESNGLGVEKVPELSWAARLQKSPSLPAPCEL